jgi:hypothetical protein
VFFSSLPLLLASVIKTKLGEYRLSRPIEIKIEIVWNKGNEFTHSTSVNNCQIYFDVRNATHIKLGFAWVSSGLLGFN